MMTIETGLEERQEHERPEQLHEQHLDDDSDGRDHAEERHGPAVQLRKDETVPLHETAPLEVVALPGLWLPHVAPQSQFLWPPWPTSVAPFTPRKRRE